VTRRIAEHASAKAIRVGGPAALDAATSVSLRLENGDFDSSNGEARPDVLEDGLGGTAGGRGVPMAYVKPAGGSDGPV